MQIQGQYIPAGATVYNSSAAEETKLLKSGGGLLFAIAVTNFNAGARFLYLFDSLTATGTPVVPPIPLTATGTGDSQKIIALPYAVPFTTGLFAAASSTGATFTAAAANDIRLSAVTK